EDAEGRRRRVDLLGERDGLLDRLLRLAGAAEHEVSVGVDPDLVAVAEGLADLLDGDALLHDVEDRLVAALDAELHVVAARLLEEGELVPGEADARAADPGEVELLLDHALADLFVALLDAREELVADVDLLHALLRVGAPELEHVVRGAVAHLAAVEAGRHAVGAARVAAAGRDVRAV